MKCFEFETLCGELLINPELALENENIVDALKDRDDEKVIELLKNDF